MARFRKLPCQKSIYVVERSDLPSNVQQTPKISEAGGTIPKPVSLPLGRPSVPRTYSHSQLRSEEALTISHLVDEPRSIVPKTSGQAHVNVSTCFSGSSKCICASPSCIASPSNTAAQESFSDVDQSASPRGGQDQQSMLQIANQARIEIATSMSRSVPGSTLGCTRGNARRNSSVVSPLPSPFLTSQHDHSSLSERGSSKRLSPPQVVMRASKRCNNSPGAAIDPENFDPASECDPDSSTTPDHRQSREESYNISSSSDSGDTMNKSSYFSQAKSTSKRIAAHKTKRNISPIVQVPTKRKRTQSIAMSDVESLDSESDVPLLRHARKRPATVRPNTKRRVSVSSITTPITAKKKPAGRQLRNTRARQERTEHADESDDTLEDDDDSQDGNWQGDDANDLGIVRTWLRTKGYWHGAPQKVKRALS